MFLFFFSTSTFIRRSRFCSKTNSYAQMLQSKCIFTLQFKCAVVLENEMKVALSFLNTGKKKRDQMKVKYFNSHG